MAVDSPELGQAYGQVAIGSLLARVDRMCMGQFMAEQEAVDLAGLETVWERTQEDSLGGHHRHLVPFDDRWILAVLVVGEVPGSLVELESSDVRREHLVVALA